MNGGASTRARKLPVIPAPRNLIRRLLKFLISGKEVKGKTLDAG